MEEFLLDSTYDQIPAKKGTRDIFLLRVASFFSPPCQSSLTYCISNQEGGRQFS
jgi:hypothetical protein